MNLQEHDRIQIAFQRTFCWGVPFFASCDHRIEMFNALNKWRRHPRKLGNELWRMFHERWPSFIAYADWIDNRLGREFVRAYRHADE